MTNDLDAFVQHGQSLIDQEKFLVIRRDGTIPSWPWLVLGGRDPYAPAALRAYAAAAEAAGEDSSYVSFIRKRAADMESTARDDGHENGPDDPAIVQIIRDGRGGKVFISAAWDAAQVQREAEKATSGE